MPSRSRRQLPARGRLERDATCWPSSGSPLAVAVAECFPIELSYRNEKVTYSVSDAIWTGALLTSPASVLILAMAAGVLVGQSVQPWAPLKVAFNVGQFAIGITAAVAVFDAFGSPPVTEPAAWAAAAVAMAAFQATNTVLMGAIIALTERQPFWQVALVPTAVLHWIGNLSIGILGALIWHAEPVALPLLLVPTVLTFLAYRGWLTTVQERDQMRELATAADSISESGDLEPPGARARQPHRRGRARRNPQPHARPARRVVPPRAPVPPPDVPRVAHTDHDLPRPSRGARPGPELRTSSPRPSPSSSTSSTA